MAGRSDRRLRRSVAVVACLAVLAAVLTGSPASGTGPGNPLRVLQMNLCDSGIAGCYTGRSVPEAAAVIRANVPDLVTLNEVCQDDVSELDRTLAGRYPGGTVVSAFKAAGDRRTGGLTRCRNGQPYGIGLLVHVVAPDQGYTTDSGIYPTQDAGDPEERAWLCVHATHLNACTTHLANASAVVALAQCGYLLNTVIPAAAARNGYQPTVLGGDLNLASGGAPDMRSCVPAGYLHFDDGAVQHIVATPDFTAGSSGLIGMHGSTDHPGLLVTLTEKS